MIPYSPLTLHFLLVLFLILFFHIPPTNPITIPTSVCSSRADIIVVVDGSRSVVAADFILMKDFCAEMVNNFNVSADNVNIGLVQFSTDVRVESAITTSKVAFLTAVQSMAQLRSYTHMELGIDKAVELFDQHVVANPNRAEVRKSIILITDGENTNALHIPAAQNARDRGIELFAVGVGSGVTRATLESMASEPQDHYVFTAASFSDLQNIAVSLAQTSCVEIYQFDPPSGCNRSDTNIAIYGNGFKPTSYLKCRFYFSESDIITQTATYINETKVQCTLRQEDAVTARYGVVWLDISLNGVSFTDSKVEFRVDKCHTCYGVPSNVAGVCNSGGVCLGTDMCSCYASGMDPRYPCNVPIYHCFGYTSLDADACSGRGTCNGTNFCDCQYGFKGEECQYVNYCNVTQDDPFVCSSHGTCNYNNYTCSCDYGFVGMRCDKFTCHGHTANDTSVCSSHGQCLEVDTCDCDKGYYGANCENIDYCAWVNVSSREEVCSYHGECPNAAVECSCDPGYHGPTCNLIQCFGRLSNDSSVCGGHGECTTPDNCVCHDRYLGWNCGQFDFCSTITFPYREQACSNHGSCANNATGVECACDTGYNGAACNVPQCFGRLSSDTSVCGGHGECIAYDDCECDSAYFGGNCDQMYFCSAITYSYRREVCSNHGRCANTATGTGGVCACDAGYHGAVCNVPQCFGKPGSDSSVCGGHGQCTAPDNCVCEKDYIGRNCQIFDVCVGRTTTSRKEVCSSHGECEKATSVMCTCDKGYLGAICDSSAKCFGWSSTHPLVCSGHGSCVGTDQCVCDIGYAGGSCELLDVCEGRMATSRNESCSNHGECSNSTSLVCTCDTGYVGEACNVTTCYGTASTDSSVCSSHGACTDVDQCECAEGYIGEQCTDLFPPATQHVSGGSLLALGTVIGAVSLCWLWLLCAALVCCCFACCFMIQLLRTLHKRRKSRRLMHEPLLTGSDNSLDFLGLTKANSESLILSQDVMEEAARPRRLFVMP